MKTPIFAAICVTLALQGCAQFGASAEGTRLARMQHSPQWRDGHFQNPQEIRSDYLKMVKSMFDSSDYAEPSPPQTVKAIDPKIFDTTPASGLRATWFGHSSTLVEVDGYRVLTDPIWSERASPFQSLGPKRWYPPLIVLDELPLIDAVVISHDHYDHLDYGTIVAMKDWKNVFIVPLGLGAHLARWGIPENRIIELDWWESAKIRDLTITCTPARHASGRLLLDKDSKLWSGWAITGAKHRVYYSGDTGLFPGMREIGERLGPFDLAMIESGQYHSTWPDWHVGPEQAVAASQMVKGRVMLPVHWDLFKLALHGWTEPVERVVAEAKRLNVKVVTPRPGESIEPDAVLAVERWWPNVPWETDATSPIVSSQMNSISP